MKLVRVILLILVGFSTGAYAGPYTDDMSKCLVKNTTPQDKETLIKWIFAAMATHPSVKTLSNVSVKQGDVLNKDTAGLMTELLIRRCKIEAQQAVKYEGEIAIRSSFQILGQVAMQELMTNAEVTKYIAGMAASVDKKAFDGLFDKKTPAVEEPVNNTPASELESLVRIEDEKPQGKQQEKPAEKK